MKKHCTEPMSIYQIQFMALNSHFLLSTYTRNLFKSCLSGDIGGEMRRALIVLGVLLFSIIPAPPVSAQQFGPGVELDCSTDMVDLDVSPSSTKTTDLQCTLTSSWPTVQEVDISIELFDDNEDIEITPSPSVAAPSKVTVDGGGETEFTVTFSGSKDVLHWFWQFNITATVTSINSVPASGLGLTSEFDGTLYIEAYAEFSLDLNSMTRNMDAGSTEEVVVEMSIVTNVANGDYASLWVENWLPLDAAGFKWEIVSLEGEACGLSNCEFDGDIPFNIPRDTTITLVLNLTAPSAEVEQEFEIEICGYTQIDPLSHKCDSFKVKVAAEPKDALGTVGGAIGVDGQTMMMVIVGGGGGLGLLLVMMVVLKVNKTKKRRAQEFAEMEDDDDFLDLDDFEEEDDLDFGDL